MGVSFTGNWKGLIKTLREPEFGESNIRPALERSMDAFQAAIVKRMWVGPHAALKPYTIAKKTMLGRPFPEQPWIETGWLQNNFVEYSAQYRSNTRAKTFTAIKKYSNKAHPESGESVKNIMTALEYGDSEGKITPRPVIQPAIGDAKDYCGKVLLDAVTAGFKKLFTN